MKPIIIEELKKIPATSNSKSEHTIGFIGIEKTGQKYLILPLEDYIEYIIEGRDTQYNLYKLELYSGLLIIFLFDKFRNKIVKKVIRISPVKIMEEDEFMNIMMEVYEGMVSA